MQPGGRRVWVLLSAGEGGRGVLVVAAGHLRRRGAELLRRVGVLVGGNVASVHRSVMMVMVLMLLQLLRRRRNFLWRRGASKLLLMVELMRGIKILPCRKTGSGCRRARPAPGGCLMRCPKQRHSVSNAVGLTTTTTAAAAAD